MKMKKAAACVYLLFFSISLVACMGRGFSGSRMGNDRQLIMDYKVLNTTETQELKLEAGETVYFDFVRKSGSVDIRLQREGEEPIYKGTNLFTSTFRVGVEDSGTYTVYVTGRHARGSISVTVSSGTDGLPERNDSAEGTGASDAQDLYKISINGKEYYMISTKEQLRSLESCGLDKNYMQQEDIDLSEEEWIPIGTADNPFTGSYNGNGFRITGLTAKNTDTSLFGAAREADIYNITLKEGDLPEEIDSLICENAEDCNIYDIFAE